MLPNSKNNAFIILKNHKHYFQNNPKVKGQRHQSYKKRIKTNQRIKTYDDREVQNSFKQKESVSREFQH